MNLSETPAGTEWLRQFSKVERETAAELVDEVLLVSRNDFVDGLWKSLDQLEGERANPARKMALYAERPIKTSFGRIPAFFPNSRHGRAMGAGVPPIVVDPRDQEVGSEGVVAQLITDYCRSNPLAALSHPGPTKLRSDKVEEIVILSDFIGSGRRIIRMLESFRYVATIRSWRSYHLVRFVVIAYSGIVEGIRAVQSHKLKPNVLIQVGCPTIANTFRATQRIQIEALCEAHPTKHKMPFGFNDCAALIAFAHGCPNNVPQILHSRAAKWNPLFAGRSTSGASPAFLTDGDDLVVSQRMQNLLGIRNARLTLGALDQNRWISSMLILAAAQAGLRAVEAISARTHLKLPQVAELINIAKDARWLTDTGSLTRLGRKELANMRKRRKQKPVLPSETNKFYYPTQLRAP